MSFTPLYQLRGTLSWPIRGRVQINGQPLIRTYQLNPVDPGYQDKVTDTYPGRLPNTLVMPFDFRAGRITVYYPYQRPFLLPGQPTTFEAGRIEVIRPTFQSTGGLSDWAAFPAAAIDPRDFLLESATAMNSAPKGSMWNRHSAVFSVSRGTQSYHPRVSFVGVGAKISAVPAAERQYLSAVQLERAPIGDTVPTAYSTAREVRVYVKPDRLNYSDNPSFEVNATDWSAGYTNGGAITVDQGNESGKALYGTGYLRANVAAQGGVTPSYTVTAILNELLPRRWYTFSIYCRSELNVANVVPEIIVSATYNPITYADNVFNSGRPDYRRIAMSFYVGDMTSQPVSLRITGTTGGAAVNAYFDGVLIEQGEELGDYFDGYSGADYMWTNGGTFGRSKSFYYLNRAERNAAMKRLIPQNIPLGIGYAEPIFGIPPSDDSENEPIVLVGGGYGSGNYGEGNYG